MASYKSSTQANSAIIGIYNLLMTVFIIGGLYFGQQIIIPLALAILLTFLLSPIVTKLERWSGRVPAVLTVVIVIFLCASVISYIVSRELSDLIYKLPSYKGNIETKFSSFNFVQSGFFSNIWEEILNSAKSAIPKKLVESPDIASNITQTAQSVITSLLHIMANVGLILLLVFFMLLNREDLRGRIIRLIGQGRIRATTLAMNDASNRISHYLFMELVVNSTFGIILAVILYLIGIPNAILWGGLLTVLRFIPYVGTWIAAIIPIALSFVISTSWLTPLFTISVYMVLDLTCSNFLEPLLYGASTGVSSTALIIAAVFWTLLWGPVGLLLAIPLTVCLVVIGRHVPKFGFLCIILSDDKPLEAHAECYHRLLTEGPNDGLAFVEKYLKEQSLVSLYDLVLLPVLINIETDLSSEILDSEKALYLYQSIQEIMEYVNDNTKLEDLHSDAKFNYPIFSIPARALRDEIAGEMLTQILIQQSFSAKNISCGLKNDEIVSLVENNNIKHICISMVYPSTILDCRSLCKKLRSLKFKPKILLGLWGYHGNKAEIEEKIRTVGADDAVFSLAEALALFDAELGEKATLEKT